MSLSTKPQTIDQATIDFYVAKGRRERSRAFAEMIRGLFSAPASKPETASVGCAA